MRHGVVRSRPAIVAVLCGLLLAPSAQGDVDTGQLIVFVQPETSLGQQFTSKHQSAVEAVAAELGVPVSIVDASSRAPVEVAITPLIVFQNFRGRSIFQGRFTDTGRIKSFVQTSRFAPQQDVDFSRDETPLWQMGRTQVATPIKVVAPTGARPHGLDDSAFRGQALQAMYEGFASLKLAESISLGRSDRMFYMDVYPWISEEDSLYLSLALFSQFHCKDPIFESSQPLVAVWQERQALFGRAAARLEAAMREQLRVDANGDGFDVVRSSVSRVTWEELGLALPAAPPRVAVESAGLQLVQNWQLRVSEDQLEPAIQFRFPAPIDHYRGVVGKATGQLKLGPQLSFEEATGWVEVDVRSTTMGTKDLDETIQGKTFLRAAEFPIARFTMQSMQADGNPLGFGALSQVTITGLFTMRGSTLPITLVAQVEPLVTPSRQVRLLVVGEFTVNLKKPFGMLAADGPYPQNETVIIGLTLPFAPAGPDGVEE